MYKVILFYRYIRLFNVDDLVNIFRSRLHELDILGRLLIAEEGINGTLSGTSDLINIFMVEVESVHHITGVDWKISLVDSPPFLGLSVRRVGEIISCGTRGKTAIDQQVDFDATCFGGLKGTGQHLTPAEFHTHLQNREKDKSLLVDIRNEFEHNIGHFDGATALKTVTYSQTWGQLDDIIKPHNPETPVYMYCTGGIRCEKASAYLKSKGMSNVYQLAGGIHRYLEASPTLEGPSQFLGKNFVFDSRVAVTADTNTGFDAAKNNMNGSSSSGSAVIKGRCLECQHPHDQYSGRICCTVCRQPALYCGACVESNPNKGEYHCASHRHLRHCYFTVLGAFPIDELKRQKAALITLEQPELSAKEKGKNRRRTYRRQAEKITVEIAERARLGQENALSPGLLPDNPMSRSGWGFWNE